MNGHEPLLAMRRKGYAPAQGVRLDVGFVDPHSANAWHRKGMPCAVVHLADADDLARLDLRFLLGLDAVIVGPAYQAPERFVRAVAAVQRHHPASIVAVGLDQENRAAEAQRFAGGVWASIQPKGVRLWSC